MSAHATPHRLGLSFGAVGTIFKREMATYFATPLAYVFIVVFLVLAGSFTFYLGNFFDRGQADLISFFQFHPWLYVVLIPAISMRLWAEEINSGTIELLMTLPITTADAVLGKYLAAWAFTGVSLALTFPLWITINYLGSPDNGAVLAGYIGSFFMAGGYLALGSFISALTRNQVIAFVIATAVCFILTAAGSPLVTAAFSSWAGDGVVAFVRSMSFMNNFQDIMRGVLDLRDVVYFASLILFFLFCTVAAVNRFKGA
ncbi:MAG: ABC transporter permease subunit [Alphaproteobacteria bacterium]|nr:ABC transporter permease subunit [Alphaproteobacteria bacterium]